MLVGTAGKIIEKRVEEEVMTERLRKILRGESLGKIEDDPWKV